MSFEGDMSYLDGVGEKVSGCDVKVLISFRALKDLKSSIVRSDFLRRKKHSIVGKDKNYCFFGPYFLLFRKFI